MTDDTDEPHNHPDPLTHTHDRATSPEAEPHRAVAGADRATNRRGTTDRIRYYTVYGTHTRTYPLVLLSLNR